MDHMGGTGGGEAVPDTQRIGRRIVGKVEGEPVREDPPGLAEAHRSVEEGFPVQFQAREPVGSEVEARKDERGRVLEESTLSLEVMLGQVHTFLPDNPGQGSRFHGHRGGTSWPGGEIRLLAGGRSP